MAVPRLITGDPSQAPCTFSRFILPFRWEQGKRMTKPTVDWNEKWHFDESGGNDWLHAPGGPRKGNRAENIGRHQRMDGQRRTYLTPETGRMLFDKSLWAVLKPPASKDGDAPWKMSWKIRNRKAEPSRATIHLRPSAIVLFDWRINGDPDSRSHPSGTGLGYLITEAYFEGDFQYRDLLEFNEKFRYWRCPFRGGAGAKLRDPLFQGMPDRWFSEKNDPVPCLGDKIPPGPDLDTDQEDTIFTERWIDLLKLPVRTRDGRIFRFVNDESAGNSLEWLRDPSKEDNRGWMVHADDRMLVASCAIVKEEDGWKPVQGREAPPLLEQRRGAEENFMGFAGAWIKLLNVDGAGGDPLEMTPFEQRWAMEEQRTYLRWAHYSCLFGYTYHSAAMLATPNMNPPTWRHFAEMYFDFLLIMLHLRTRLFCFSEELSMITLEHASASSDSRRKDFRQQFADFRQEFDIFTNLYQFPMLSNQQQAVEMYTRLRRAFDIDDFYEEIEQEIKGTHERLELLETQNVGQMTSTLTVVATVGLLLGLVAGVLGMNLFIPGREHPGDTLSAFQFQDWPILAGTTLLFLGSGVFLLLLSPLLGKFLRDLLDPKKKPPKKILLTAWIAAGAVLWILAAIAFLTA